MQGVSRNPITTFAGSPAMAVGGQAVGWAGFVSCLLVVIMVAGGAPAELLGSFVPPSATTDWLTQGIADRLNAGEAVPLAEIPGFPIAAADAQGYAPPLPYTRLRPGMPITAKIVVNNVPNCTGNFVFANAAEGRLAIGTAGHCTLAGETQRTVWFDVETRKVRLEAFGRTIFSTGDGGVGTDFALIEIDAGLHAVTDSALAVIDGPCGWRKAVVPGDAVQYYGHGVGVGTGGQPRTGVVLADEGRALRFAAAPAGAIGDSGSPIRFAGDYAAAAIDTHGLALPVSPVGFGTSMPRVFELLNAASLGAWKLVDSPNCNALRALVPFVTPSPLPTPTPAP